MPMIRINDVSLHRAAKAKAFADGRTLMEIVEEMLRAYVGTGVVAKPEPKRRDATCRKGDWVRFYRDNKLVIALVEYVRVASSAANYLQTADGEVPEHAVIECRPENNS